MAEISGSSPLSPTTVLGTEKPPSVMPGSFCFVQVYRLDGDNDGIARESLR